MVKTMCEIECYEVNNEQQHSPVPKLIVRNHWNRDNFVVLEFNGQCITVNEKDLHLAINRTSTSSFLGM